MILSRPLYRFRPLGSVVALGRALDYQPEQLIELADRADDLYRLADTIQKSNGALRYVYEALEPLKTVQRRIVDRLLAQIEYPSYLMGSLPDPDGVRGYLKNATNHGARSILIKQDAVNFFPSITAAMVVRISMYALNFPPDVSQLLARLCTRYGRVVQGASPSSYIANTILFSREPLLHQQLACLGFDYSRYLDDLCASSIRSVTDHEVAQAVQLLRALLEREGFAVNRTKQLIARRGRARQVHNLNVEGQRPTLPLAERKRIRFAVYQIEQAATAGVSPDVSLRRQIQSAFSRVDRLMSLHPAQGVALHSRLSAVVKSLPRAGVLPRQVECDRYFR
jgi:hypothetical protein